MEDDEVNFICDAVNWVACNGFNFLKVYDKNMIQGNYSHKSFQRNVPNLDEIDVNSTSTDVSQPDYERILREANEALIRVNSLHWEIKDDDILSAKTPLEEKYRWFCAFEDKLMGEKELVELQTR